MFVCRELKDLGYTRQYVERCYNILSFVFVFRSLGLLLLDMYMSAIGTASKSRECMGKYTGIHFVGALSLVHVWETPQEKLGSIEANVEIIFSKLFISLLGPGWLVEAPTKF